MIEFVVDERDEREILETIRSARRDAEFVVVSVHSHEPANASAEPAEFFRRFARPRRDGARRLAIALVAQLRHIRPKAADCPRFEPGNSDEHR